MSQQQVIPYLNEVKATRQPVSFGKLVWSLFGGLCSQKKRINKEMGRSCSSSKFLFILPLVACLSFPITFAVSYGYSVYNGNVNGTGDFPYISETGTKPPESCVFGQLLNIAAVVSGLTIYVRYRQIQQALVQFLPSLLSIHAEYCNIATLILGMAASFGVSMVGNFQMTNLKTVHFIGAFLAFVLGAIYAWMQCYLSFRLLQFMCTKRVFYFRIVCSLIISIFLLGTMVGAFMYEVHPENQTYRLLSTSSEWIMALGLACLFASYVHEFKATKVEKPRISIIQEKLSKV